MKFLGGIVAFASMTAGVGAAGAADMNGPAYHKAPPPAYLSDWSGFYIGINGGYGWGDTRSDNNENSDEVKFLNTRPKGGLFGGHAGYNRQYGKVVTGVEVDFDGASITSADTIASANNNDGIGKSQSVKFDELATARARLGYALLGLGGTPR